jgi:hypothetical protein
MMPVHRTTMRGIREVLRLKSACNPMHRQVQGALGVGLGTITQYLQLAIEFVAGQVPPHLRFVQCGVRNDGNASGTWVLSQHAGRFEAIALWHREVHQDDTGRPPARHVDRLHPPNTARASIDSSDRYAAIARAAL